MNLFRVMARLALVALIALAAGARSAQEADRSAVRFEAVDVFIDPGAQPLAAYQIDLHDRAGVAMIVGIEGGEHAEFRLPPYYDTRALMNDRVILGAFSIAPAERLPARRTRVATLHLRIAGEVAPEFAAEITVAGTTGGGRIDVALELMSREDEPR